MPGRDVKHQGASDPSGFRQKFSRRSLCRHAAQPRRKAMLMWELCIPTLAGHARGGGVDCAPVALAFPAEAVERRGFLARLCLGPLDGPRPV